MENKHAFGAEERAALYKTVFNRRDVRGQFTSDPIPDSTLARILVAAHHGPSVGFMQPWDFVLVRDEEVKKRVHAAFVKANAEATAMFEGEKQQTYAKLKLEGILESPLNICVTCDRDRSGPVVVGRTHQKEMDLYSSVCAVQNLWLAARCEGVGVGWVSIMDKGELKEILGLPKRVVPIAYLCLGCVTHFHERPELEKAGWRSRLPLGDLIHFDKWDEKFAAESEPLLGRVTEEMDAVRDHVMAALDAAE